MNIKDKIELVSKTIDALYKKLIVLVAISGGFGAYAIKFVQESHWVGYVFICAFMFVSIGVFVTYIKLNIFVKKSKGYQMNEIGLAIIPIGFFIAGVIGYIAVKKDWKIADIF